MSKASRRAILMGATILPLSRAVPQSNGISGIFGSISLRDFGADPTGRTSAVQAFRRALATGRVILGFPNDIYLLDATVVVPANGVLLGNGATIRLDKKVIGLHLPHDNCKVLGWKIEGRNGLYAVLNTGQCNEFSNNICCGNVGHFFFSSNAQYVFAVENQVEGMSADHEITTAIAVEKSRKIYLARNIFHDIPVGWSIQIRDESCEFVIESNEFRQTRWTADALPSSDRQNFEMTLGSVCHLKRIHVNGKPLSTGYSIVGDGPSYLVKFEKETLPSDKVTLVGYRGAENIQINTASHSGKIINNRMDGTGDSGIVCFGHNLQVVGNSINNCGYAGIAVYGDQDNIVISGNTITDCSQLDDSLSSPDDPQQASVFAGAILASGDNATITDNIIRNLSETMRYGVRINKTSMTLRTDGSAAITIMRNRYEGKFTDGRIFAPNETPGARINSLAVDSAIIHYPSEIDLDAPWVNAPPCGASIRSSGFGNTWAVRDPSVTRRSDAVSLRTVPNEYIDFDLSEAELFRDCNVTINFWAKANGGTSYASVFTVLAGLPYPLTALISSTIWERYTISFPLTANLESIILIRFGADKGSANIQDIDIIAQKL